MLVVDVNDRKITAYVDESNLLFRLAFSQYFAPTTGPVVIVRLSLRCCPREVPSSNMLICRPEWVVPTWMARCIIVLHSESPASRVRLSPNCHDHV